MTSASPVSPAVARAAFALELARAEAATFQKAAQQRPENTSIQYKGKALEFKKWCDETQGFENEEIRYTITPQKANLFMIQKVVGRAIRKRKRASTTSADVDEAIEEGDDLDRAMAGEEPASSEVVDTPAAEASEADDRPAGAPATTPTPAPIKRVGSAVIKAYVAALVDLWKYQKSHNINSYPSPRDGPLTELIKQAQHDEEDRRRANFTDRAHGTLQVLVNGMAR